MDHPIPAEFKVVKQKGFNTIIIVDELGFTYSCSKSGNKKDPTLRSWRCSKKNKQCIASITTENTWIVARRNTHNHEPGGKIFRSVPINPGDQILQDFFYNH
jgi:hypothetical protein